MLVVYKITNKINQKCYIGSSINDWTRIQEHKNTAFNEKAPHYNYPLYKAMRKYGLENFSFEILKKKFQSIEEMENYEQKMIIFYDSKNNGYNQTEYTHCALRDPELKKEYLKSISQKCAMVDSNQNIIKIFSSYQEAARELGFPNSASSIRLACLNLLSSFHKKYFRLIDENNNVIKLPIKPYKNKKSIIAIDPSLKHNDLYFDSISNAAKILNGNRTSIEQCIKGNKRYWITSNYIFRELGEDGEIIENSILIEDALKKYERTNPIINNEQHNITEWLKIYNLSKSSFYKRIKKGMGVVEALTTPKKGE